MGSFQWVYLRPVNASIVPDDVLEFSHFPFEVFIFSPNEPQFLL